MTRLVPTVIALGAVAALVLDQYDVAAGLAFLVVWAELDGIRVALERPADDVDGGGDGADD